MLENTTIELKDYPRRRADRAVSPFRYPGGKGFLAGYLQQFIDRLGGAERSYVEPFCGGAGAALILLQDGVVNRLYLNDLDVRVYSAWRAILEETDRFVDKIRSTPVTLDSWNNFREKINNPNSKYSFEVGFATYFINRTSRSGIVTGSGPIGGYQQNGKWKLDARYYRESMIDRINWIGNQRERIEISNKPALAFLRDRAGLLNRSSTLFFVDPPYVQAGSRLYLNAMSLATHRELADVLRSGVVEHWVLTYDDDPLIRQLYKGLNVSSMQVNYSLRKTRKAQELLIHA